MRWSFRIARVAGIEIRIHATFLLLLAFIGYVYGIQAGVAGALSAVLIWLLVFLCVVLHEFGHAYAAKMYGIRTADITLLPIGGVARMERMPEKPLQELVVALAGPAVNVVIAVALIIGLSISGEAVSGEVNPAAWFSPTAPSVLGLLLEVNMMMLVFNLIPAFPLDGGRVLRALLATRMSYTQATRLAATIGQGLALALGIFAVFKGAILLILIAVFIYVGAENEAAIVQLRSVTAGLPVSSAMVTRFDTLDQRATLDQAVEALLGSSQHEFPVVDDNGGFAGLLTKHNLLVGLKQSGPDALVTDLMIKGLPAVLPQTSFDHALSLVQQHNAPALPVVDQTGLLVGLFTPENVSELLLVKSALNTQPRRRAA